MPKKTTIFIVILALVTAGLIYLAVRTAQQPDTTTPGEETPAPTQELQQSAILYFEEAEVVASPGAQITTDILLDSGGQLASGAQIYLEYDPTQLTLNSITAPTDNFFGADQSEYIVLENNINAEDGTATFIISIPPQTDPGAQVTSKPLTGIDRVATVSFTPAFGFQGTATVDITNTPNTSMVMTPDPNFLTESILLETTPLQVTVQ